MHLQYSKVEIYKIICCRRIELFTDQITKLSFFFFFFFFFFCFAVAMCDQVQYVESGTLRFPDPVSY